MKLKPDDRWQWLYDNEHDRVILDFNNGLFFQSRFSSKMLIPDAFSAHPFCVDDATLYYQFEENCRELPLDLEQCGELILNALVAYRFLKPQMPKSWHFVTGQRSCQPEPGALVNVEMTHNDHHAVLLVVEANEHASLCVLAQENLELSSGKVMHLGEAIKIMNDRLTFWQPERAVFFEQAG